MADVKISELPAAPSALLTDVVPVDQLPGPVTYKETNQQILTLFKSNGEALTKVDDTNVTLTLGGNPATALMNAASITAGWTGTLSGTRGGTGVNNGSNTATFAGSLNFASSFTTSGVFAVTQTYTGITNVTFPTSGTLATTSQLPTPAALTKVDDTNVTITLGGTPATALLQATSLTMGWSGTLSGTRGGTGVNNGASTVTLGGSLTTSGAFASTFTMTNTTSVTFPTSGTLATTSQIPTGAALTKADDTNVTLTLGGSPNTALVNAASITAGWTGQLGISRGGTGISSFGTGVQTALGQNVTGSGGMVLASSPTITTPKIAQINDTNGNTMLLFSPAASAVNYVAMMNAATGNGSQIAAAGTDTDINLVVLSQGVGTVNLQSRSTGVGIKFFTGTGYQHETDLSFSNTSATRTVTFPDASGTLTLLGNTSTGSGSVVLATSPTLTTPTIGAASATSINFGDTSLANYKEGTWTPIDASGASLSFSTAVGNYTRIGRIVIATCEVVYPSTANGSNALIGGLPFTTSASAQSQGGTVLYTTVATLARSLTNSGATTFNLNTAAGGNLTNANMSLSTNYFQIIYFV
jgi:hypothetical protein